MNGVVPWLYLEFGHNLDNTLNWFWCNFTLKCLLGHYVDTTLFYDNIKAWILRQGMYLPRNGFMYRSLERQTRPTHTQTHTLYINVDWKSIFLKFPRWRVSTDKPLVFILNENVNVWLWPRVDMRHWGMYFSHSFSCVTKQPSLIPLSLLVWGFSTSWILKKPHGWTRHSLVCSVLKKLLLKHCVVII